MSLNTIYQIYDDLKNNNTVNCANTILLLPNLIGYYLTGAKSSEITHASTTSLLNAKTKKWINEIDELNEIISKFPKLQQPATLLGYTKESLGVGRVPVINVCSHDTASAFTSVDVSSDTVIISSGTWSLIGTQLEKPILTEKAKQMNFTNELGFLNQTRFLKNTMGMWVINHIKKELDKKGKKYSFSNLEKKALLAKPFQRWIDLDHDIFQQPNNMLEKLEEYFKITNQEIVKDENTIIRMIYENMALKYRYVIESMESILNKKFSKIVIIGGGNQSKFLNRLIANITKKEVLIGPQEASVLGNGIVQMVYFNDLKDINEGKKMIKNTCEGEIYYPEDDLDYDKHYETFKKHIKKE